jgi:hypothetical protein
MVLADNAKSHANTLRVRRALWPRGNMKNLLIILLVFTSSHAFSKDWTENISCGDSIIDNRRKRKV